MIVNYSAKQGEHLEPCGSFTDAVQQAGDEGEVWLVADGEALLALPLNFDRVLIVDGQHYRTLVLRGQELSGNFPAGARAPLLTIDLDRSRISWRDENGKSRGLYSEAFGRVRPLPSDEG